MKKITAFLLIMLIGVQFLTAQNQTAQPAQPKQTAQPAQAAQTAQPAQPVAKTYAWNETTHDFGKIKQNDPAAVTFEVKNNGTAPLIITAAKSSCGCTVAEYTKEPIKPNEKGIVKATYNSARVGTFAKTVTVTFDGITAPEVLTIKGEVDAPVPATAPPAATGTTPVK